MGLGVIISTFNEVNLQDCLIWDMYDYKPLLYKWTQAGVAWQADKFIDPAKLNEVFGGDQYTPPEVMGIFPGIQVGDNLTEFQAQIFMENKLTVGDLLRFPAIVWVSADGTYLRPNCEDGESHEENYTYSLLCHSLFDELYCSPGYDCAPSLNLGSVADKCLGKLGYDGGNWGIPTVSKNNMSSYHEEGIIVAVSPRPARDICCDCGGGQSDSEKTTTMTTTLLTTTLPMVRCGECCPFANGETCDDQTRDCKVWDCDESSSHTPGGFATFGVFGLLFL